MLSLASTHSRWLATVATLYIFLQPSLAAYVQFKDCYNALPADSVSSQPRPSLESFRVELHQWNNATQIGMQILGRFAGEGICDSVPTTPYLTLDVASVIGTRVYNGDVTNVTCSPNAHSTTQKESLVSYNFGNAIDRMHPLGAFELGVRLLGADHKPFTCLEAHVTPEIGPNATAIARWIPAGILALVIATAGLKSLSQLSSSLDDDQSGPFFREVGRSHLTHIADCLSYIQFIFFSGALSLSYPGFFQPVVSHSSWSTLMTSRGPASPLPFYHGIKDGIYEVNGTFGGTDGLELMTQVIGAPVTIQTWMNVITYTALIFTLLFIIIQVGKRLDHTRDWFAPPPTPEAQAAQTLQGLKHTASTAFRALISYFLLPVVAWTTYQLGHAQIFPYYYTTISAVVLAVLIATCWWSASQFSPRHMGYLILDSSKEYQTLTSMSRSQDLLSIAMFGLSFARGAAIGGLQIAGLPQLTSLLGCEIIQVMLICLVRTPAAILSVSGLTTVARLLITLLSVPFLPYVTGLETKSIFGYIILVLHGAVLVFGFVCPSLYTIAKLGASTLRISDSDTLGSSPEEPQVYSLRRLRQRPNTVTNLSLPTLPHLVVLQPAQPERGRFPSASSSTSPSCPDSLALEDKSRYYRRPRSRRSSTDIRLQVSVSPPIPEDMIPTLHHERASSLSSSEQTSETSSADASDAVSWAEPARFANVGVDYSVREVDLYYKRAKQGDEEEQPLEPELTPRSSISTLNPRRKVSDMWKEWATRSVKGNGNDKKSFVVVRPPRTNSSPTSSFSTSTTVIASSSSSALDS
ncbi:hypothetical protein F5B22DRAFT_385346 [Xylaria bambusicola]|uniref:uncharacterized protein n=1 Tax=Xylaria bambusicola TaxID=326684 RepID=UPI002008A73C|nr:uncharacterized protein F5B22DRAFT_385346 [Xylaria bambusicola]KAI0508808.1 hypothetical protein F5B22DRAFT_385346 [Xylaria bambusicola]